MRYRRRAMHYPLAVAAVTLAAGLTGLPAATASAVGAAQHVAGHARHVATGAAPNRLTRPGRVLPPGWRTSTDRAVTVVGDATGLHVLVADESDGYAWRTVATLGVQGTDTSRWVGQACLTAGGRRAVVVYAPVQITNVPSAEDRGALAAVVDVSTGRVTPVGAGVSIAYFDPGCGTGQQAVLTQGGWGGDAAPGRPVVTRLMMLDAASGKITSTVSEPGEVTSAVPYQGAIAAAYGPGVVRIGSTGRITKLAQTTGATFRLAPDAAGGLGYQVMAGRQVHLYRFAAGQARLVGTVRSGLADLSQVGGRVFVTGPAAARLRTLPPNWQAVDAPAMAQVSSTGALAVLAVTGAAFVRGGRPQVIPGTAAPDAAQPVRIGAWVPATGKQVAFAVPAARQPLSGGLPRPLPGFPGGPGLSTHHAQASSGANATATSVDPSTVTYDPDRSCSVPRNNPKIEAYQPSDNRIEWAVDQGILGDLTNTRGPDLLGSGLPSYTPQGSSGMFPLPGLTGGGRVPAQVMLGILTQESALYQASSHVIIGEAGNFEPSFSWYGDQGHYTYVNWNASDCGYGIAQITTGMCLSGHTGCTNPFSYNDQVAVAIDYQANIAAGLRILAQDWNTLKALGITANDGNAKYIENWYFAIWDYNSGLEPNAANGNTTGCSPSPTCHDSNGDWGLGWANNPANDMYPPDRPAYLLNTGQPAPNGGQYEPSWDLAHPQYWPYQEKVLAYAANSYANWDFLTQSYVPAYADGLWPNAGHTPAITTPTQFCTSADHCNPADVPSNADHDLANPCTLTGSIADHCWWHWPSTWTTCSASCGTSISTYAAGAADPGNPGVPAGYPPLCSSSGLPSTTVIVGDTASSIPAPFGCGENWSNNGGVMTFKFGADTSTTPATYPSKIDFHQVNVGYEGHMWFTHTMAPSNISNGICTFPLIPSNPSLEVTGTWTPPPTVVGWTKLFVALPIVGAETADATYTIITKTGATPQRVLVQQEYPGNTWASIGSYNLSAGASVSMNNVTCDGNGTDDIAWDAMAFVPSQPLTTNYAAIGDSYSSGEGVSPYLAGSDTRKDQCHRSTRAYPTLVTLPGQSSPIASQATATSGVSFAFIACSGAETTGLTAAAVNTPPTTEDQNGNTDWGAIQGQNEGQDPLVEGLQVDDSGQLTSSTNLVTVSIGGNDARFADVLSGCIKTINDCVNSDYHLTRASNGKVDPQALVIFEPHVISELQTHLESVYRIIHSQAPNAEIIVVGYPGLFPSGTTQSCQVGTVAGVPVSLNYQDQNFLDSMGSQLNSTIQVAVNYARSNYGADIKFVNPTSAFSGHELCSSDPWILPLSSFVLTGAGLQLVNKGSFHPNAAGQSEFATLVNNCLAGKISC